MKFNSVREFFYKLNNTGYQLMMVPLILFIYFYAQSYFFVGQPWVEGEDLVFYIILASGMIALTILTTVYIYTKKRARKLATLVGLGLKLENVGSLLFAKMIWQFAVVTWMPLGLVATGHQMFSVFFGLTLAWYFIQWPTPERVSNLLQLRGDEKEMVISRGDAFK